MEERKRESKVGAWGKRLLVPVECLNFLGLAVGDAVEWVFVEEEGRKEVVLRKKEVSE